MKPEEAETLFRDISQFIAESHALLAQGAMMELAGLDKRIAELCTTVLELSPVDRTQYAEHMQQLLGDLKTLSDAMYAHRNAMAEEIMNLSGHRKASTAYRNTDASDKKED